MRLSIKSSLLVALILSNCLLVTPISLQKLVKGNLKPKPTLRAEKVDLSDVDRHLHSNNNSKDQIQGIPKKKAFLNSKSNIQATVKSKTRTKIVFFLILASLILDLASLVVKLITYLAYTKKINKATALLKGLLMEFYRNQLDIKRNMCLEIRMLHSGFNDVLNGIRIQLYLAKYTFKQYASKNQDSLKNYKTADSDDQFRKIVWENYLYSISEITEAIDTMRTFMSRYETAVCSYTIDLAGENVIIKSKLASLVPPQAKKQSESNSTLMKGVFFDFMIFWLQTALLGSMDFKNLQSSNLETLPVSDGSQVDASVFRNTISDQEYGDMVTASGGASVDNFGNHTGMYSSTPDGVVYIGEGCLADVIGFCNPAAMIQLAIDSRDHLQEIVKAFKTSDSDWRSRLVILMRFFSAAIFFGMFGFKLYKFITAIMVSTTTGGTVYSTMLGFSRANYTLWFDTLDASSQLLDKGFLLAALFIQKDKLEKLSPKPEQAKFDEVDDNIVEATDNVKSTFFSLISKIVIMLLLPIAYKGLYLLLKYLGGPMTTFLMIAFAAVKVVLSLKGFIESLIEMNKKRKEKEAMVGSVESEKQFYEKMNEILRLNSNYIRCKYYHILYQMFTELHKRVMGNNNDKDLLITTDTNEIAKILKVGEDNLKKIGVSTKKRLTELGITDEQTLNALVLSTIDPNKFSTSTLDNLINKDDNAPKVELFVFIEKLCRKNPIFCMKFMNSILFNDLVSNFPVPPMNKTHIKKKIYYMINFGPISNVMVIPKSMYDVDYIEKTFKDEEKESKKQTQLRLMSYFSLNACHTHYLNNFNRRAIMVFCRQSNHKIGLVGGGIRYAKKGDVDEIFTFYNQINTFSDGKNVQGPAYDYEETVIQTEFITGEYDNTVDALDMENDNYDKASYYLVSFFKYARLSSINKEETIPLLFSLRPSFQLVEKPWFKDSHRYAVFKLIAYVNYFHRLNWDLKEGQWAEMKENLQMKLVVADYVKGIDVAESKNKDATDFMEFCNDFISISTDKESAYIMYIGYPKTIKKPIDNMDHPTSGEDILNFEQIGKFRLDSFKMLSNYDEIITEMVKVGKNNSKIYDLTQPEGDAMYTGPVIAKIVPANASDKSSEKYNGILQYISGKNIRSSISQTDPPSQTATKIDWKGIEGILAQLKTMICKGDCQVPDDQPIEDKSAVGLTGIETELSATANKGFNGGETGKLLIFYSYLKVPDFLNPKSYKDFTGGFVAREKYTSPQIQPTHLVPQFIYPHHAFTKYISEKAVNAYRSYKDNKDKKNLMNLKGSLFFFFNHIIQCFGVSDLSFIESFFDSNGNPKVDKELRVENPNFKEDEKYPLVNYFKTTFIPHFTYFSNLFFKQLKTKRTQERIPIFFLHQTNIEKVTDSQNLKGKNVFDLKEFEQLGLMNFYMRLIFPIRKKSDEEFYNVEVENCELSPESELKEIKYYQLNTGKKDKAISPPEKKEKEEDKSTKKTEAQNDSGIKYDKNGFVMFDEDDEETTVVSLQNTKEITVEEYNEEQENAIQRFANMKISEISRIPKADIAYVEFETREKPIDKRNMLIFSNDFYLQILLKRNYIVHFPPVSKDSETESDTKVDNDDDIPANYAYQFKYSSTYCMVFRLWIRYNYSPSHDSSELCNDAHKVSKLQKKVKMLKSRRGGI